MEEIYGPDAGEKVKQVWTKSVFTCKISAAGYNDLLGEMKQYLISCVYDTDGSET
jgi:hypothetical protein